MIKTAIFGAGQAGQMVRNWLPASHELICFIDNNKDKQGTDLDGIPVLSLGSALEKGPERIWIATLNTEAAVSIENQIRSMGFKGTLRYAHAFRDAQDIRLAALRMIAEEIENRDLSGAAAELGVFRGEFASEINRVFPDRELYLFDTFEGFSDEDIEKEREISGHQSVWHPDFSETGIEIVREKLPHPEKVHFIKGHFPGSTDQLNCDNNYVFVNIDPDLYEPTIQGLRYFWPRMVRNGVVMIHDCYSLQFPGVGKAVREFTEENDIMPIPMSDLHGTAVLIKQ